MTTISAEDILAARPSDAGKILGSDPKAARKAFHRLASTWHPDVCKDPRSSDVFARLVMLRDAISTKAARTSGKAPKGSPSHVLKTTDGKTVGMRPLAVSRGDTGEILVGGGTITFLHDADMVDLGRAELDAIDRFRFADDRMRREMTRFLPEVVRRIDLADGRLAVAMKRGPDDILLSDLLARGPLEPIHAAWLCSGLLNIAAWLTWSDICHGAIDPRHILISPAKHEVRLIGGWGFSTTVGARPQALPERTLNVVPRILEAGEKASPQLDLEMIRRTVREALGDPSGARLHEGSLPRPLVDWLTFPPAKDGIADYTAWNRALDASWERRFVELDVSPEDVYGP
jgi:hypothetical protein